MGGFRTSEVELNEALGPFFKADRVRTPILGEFVAETGFVALEFSNAVTSQGGQAEMVFYPGEAHVFEQPAPRYYSMRRNFDWFNFWLLGEEDPSPEKRCQYERWRAMRSALNQSAPAPAQPRCS